jgi:HSP20 family molecular chaperone IbpA
MHEWFNGSDADKVYRPLVDIRETPDQFVLDVELPGLKISKDLKISWSSSRVIVVHGDNQRHAIPGVDEGSSEAAGEKASSDANGANQTNQEDAVHYVERERHIGKFRRVFEFATDVDHETMKTILRYGLLTIVVDKLHGDGKIEHVEVDHEFDGPDEKK